MQIPYLDPLRHARIAPRKKMTKLGTLKIGTVETTPVVWKDKLIRFEWDRNHGCYHFVDTKTEQAMPGFAEDHSFGCCISEDGIMYCHGTRGPGNGNIIDVYWSGDLIHWNSKPALILPEDYGTFNTSVCKGPDGYIMAIEIGGPNPIVGKRFTIIFAHSTDLLNWELLDPKMHIYAQDRYTACPVIRYVDGYYYMIYLEEAPCHRWIPYIVRSADLLDFEVGQINPIVCFDDDDKKIIDPERFTEDEIRFITEAVDCNNSDFDLCEYDGKTIINYSWGNQLGREFLALAEYDGPMSEFLASFFA